MSGTSGQMFGTSGQSPELPENLLKFTQIRFNKRFEDGIQICEN